MTLNMKKIAENIISKHPYKIMMDEKNKNTPATEQTMFTDVLTFSVHKVGSKFQYIPYSLDINRYGEKSSKTVEIIGTDGHVLEKIECSCNDRSREEDAYKKELKEFRFKSESSNIAVAMILTENGTKGTQKVLMLLSKPYTIKEMQSLRDEVYDSMEYKRVSETLGKIQMIWK